MVCITRGLAEVLLSLASEADPESVTASLAVSPAGDLTAADAPEATAAGASVSEALDAPEGADLTPETPVFTDFYLPDTAKSVTAVFGVDLATPPGQTQGRFVSHPMGRLELDRTDDLHEAVFVAVPPWDIDSLAAFDRSGRRRSLYVLDAHPPEATLADDRD